MNTLFKCNTDPNQVDSKVGKAWATSGKLGLLGLTLSLTLTSCFEPRVPDPVCNLSAAEWSAIEDSNHSVAQIWDELALNAIRNVLPQPTAHSRNLFHMSAAMYDVWASYNSTAKGVFSTEKNMGSTTETVQAIQYAARRVLKARFVKILPSVAVCFDNHLTRAGLDANNMGTLGDMPAAVGNRIGQAVLDAAQNDGSNEVNNYADTSGYTFINAPLQPDVFGTTLVNPDHWQRLQLREPFTQNGIAQSGPQPFMGAHWGNVKPFAMPARTGRFYNDPGAAPSLSDPLMRTRWVADILRRQSQLDPTSEATINLSPAVMGNNPLGTNAGTGHPINPVTGAVYSPNVVKLADFGRIIAEYWADGPRSETPPDIGMCWQTKS